MIELIDHIDVELSTPQWTDPDKVDHDEHYGNACVLIRPNPSQMKCGINTHIPDD